MLAEPPVAVLHEITTAPVPLRERTRRVVACLSAWLDVDALGITLSGPDQRSYVAVGSADLDRPVPAGFHVGVAVPLAEPDGSDLGTLSVLFPDADPPSADVQEGLRRLGPLLARAVSPLRSLSGASRLVGGATAGVALLRDGRCLRLPGLDDHPLLRADSAMVELARRTLLERLVHRSFLWPADDGPGATGHLCVTVLTANDAPPFVLGTILLCQDADSRGLTPRELEVLGLLVEGSSNQQIARQLSVAPRTVATHVEHVLHKLDAPSRTLAAVRAEREGLHVPPSPTTRA